MSDVIVIVTSVFKTVVFLHKYLLLYYFEWHFSCIRCNMQYWPSYGWQFEFQYGTAAICDFLGYQFCWWNLIEYLSFGVCVKFCANPFTNAELPPNNWFHNGSFRHLGFLHMQILMANVILEPCLSIKFGSNMCNNGLVMAKNVIFSMAAAAILDFVGY